MQRVKMCMLPQTCPPPPIFSVFSCSFRELWKDETEFTASSLALASVSLNSLSSCLHSEAAAVNAVCLNMPVCIMRAFMLTALAVHYKYAITKIYEWLISTSKYIQSVSLYQSAVSLPYLSLS